MNQTIAIAGTPLVSVIIPAHNAGHYLARTLPAVMASSLQDFEIIVVNDHSSDDTGTVARKFGARVVLNPMEPNPSSARNAGVAASLGSILVFLDADVEPHPRTLEGFVEGFRMHPDVSAIFGSYDDSPGCGAWVSRFKNLMHHYVHQRHPGVAATFWTGCGAVRREAFLSTGPFRPVGISCVEDIDYGHRLNDGGKTILLMPEIQGKHLKCWTLVGLLRADVLHRAAPWTIMMVRRGRMDSTLNLGRWQMVSALLAVFLIPAMAAAIWKPAAGAVVIIAIVGLVFFLNRRYVLYMKTLGGRAFAAFCFVMLIFYFWYGVAGCGLGLALSPFVREEKRVGEGLRRAGP